jgi:major type 1 subunit fimbrin (pilin)
MKHITLAAALVLALGAASTASAASSAGGTITFTGVVNDVTCTVTGGAGTDGGTGNFAVALDPVPATALATVGAVAAPKLFDVIIGGPGQGTCQDGHVATMSFLTSSPRIDAVSGALTNVLVGETNAQIQLADDAGVAINLATPGQSWDADIGDAGPNTATLRFRAQYLAANAAATPGLISTNVVYSVVYN